MWLCVPFEASARQLAPGHGSFLVDARAKLTAPGLDRRTALNTVETRTLLG